MKLLKEKYDQTKHHYRKPSSMLEDSISVSFAAHA